MSGNSEATFDLVVDSTSCVNTITMFFDRFNIVRCDPVMFMSFWRSGDSEDRFSCVMSISDARKNLDSIKQYVEKVGIHPGDLPEFKTERIPTREKAPIVRFATCTRIEDMAETGFLFFPTHLLINAKKNTRIGTKLIAALLSDVPTQINFLVHLIETGNAK